MQEYHGPSAKTYKQTRGKQFILFPRLRQYIPDTSDQAALLDVDCGNGDLYQIANEKGYSYHGLDASKDLIERAKQEYPKGSYSVLSATDFAHAYPQRFSTVTIVTLFPSLRRKEDITTTLRESRKVLNDQGRIIVAVPHPCFDGYMQHKLFNGQGVTTDFKGYFSSGAPVEVAHTLDGKQFVFRDYHWTLHDYVKCIAEAGLSIRTIDECRPDPSLRETNEAFFEERSVYPTYVIFVLDI